MEFWKTVPGYSGLYEVSNLGRVRSYNNKSNRWKPGRIMKPIPHSVGYTRQSLMKDDERVMVYTHVLVAFTFFGPKPEGYEVNHKNLNKKKNNIENLEYLTHKDNIVHALEEKGKFKNYIYSDKEVPVMECKPCKNCGAKFWTDNPQRKYCCKLCCRMSNKRIGKKYYQDHKDELKKYGLEYYYSKIYS